MTLTQRLEDATEGTRGAFAAGILFAIRVMDVPRMDRADYPGLSDGAWATCLHDADEHGNRRPFMKTSHLLPKPSSRVGKPWPKPYPAKATASPDTGEGG